MKLTALWRRVPKPVRAGWITAWITFLSTMLTIATGLLPELATAIGDRNFAPFYNSLNFAATAAVSAATAFLAGLVNAAYRWLKPIEEAYRTDPPHG